MTLRLDIGPGDIPADGYVSVAPFGPADVAAPMWDLPWPDGVVEEIRAWHCLEHVAAGRVDPSLCEWRRVLRPGGTLDLMVPDLDYACRYWLGLVPPNRPDDFATDWSLALLFGKQDDEGQFHRTGFNRQRLVAALWRAGFTDTSVDRVWSHAQQCLRVVLVR